MLKPAAHQVDQSAVWSSQADASAVRRQLEALLDDRLAAVDMAVDATHALVKRQKLAGETYGAAAPQACLLLQLECRGGKPQADVFCTCRPRWLQQGSSQQRPQRKLLS